MSLLKRLALRREHSDMPEALETPEGFTDPRVSSGVDGPEWVEGKHDLAYHTDVDVEPLADNDVLQYDLASGKFTAGALPHADLAGITTDDHHAKSHAHDGVDGSGTVAHADLTGIGTDDHHTRYTDAEAVTAMGVKGDANALNHDRYTDAEADARVAVHTGDTSDAHDASAISIADAGAYFTGTDVEAALQELGAGGGSGGAPTTADYLVGTAQAGLSAEIVVGTTPGGELGGTWASPTVDATHSGSSHAGIQAAAEATAAAALSSHEAAVDPHTGYRLESADHTHQSTGAQAGQLDHGLALTGLADDDHTQYLLASGARDVAGDLVPDADSTRDLGTTTDRWAQLYVDDIIGVTAPIVRTYDAGDSWTVPTAPPTLAYIIVEVVGGGGGSGGIDATGSNEASASGGGGGGGYARKLIPASTLGGNTYAITVGAGGTAGSSGGGNGGDGGDSSFAGTGITTVLGEGGSGGSGDAAASTGVTEQAGGAGGPASGGDVNVSGNTGISGITAPVGTTGRSLWSNVAGGASAMAGSVAATSFDVDGVAGNAYGGGAAGARNNAASSANHAGAAGGAGRVIVTEYYV